MREIWLPKILTVLREGYGFHDLKQDGIAGLTVAIVALPLAMALGIASGATPDKGLLTAIIAGFLISALGGSRVQIGGPTGAFVVVVFNVIHAHGYEGLIVATLMAGLLLIAAGLLRLGTWMKYMPEPVVTGFTAGIAVIILVSQLNDLFGLGVADMPAEIAQKLAVLWAARNSLGREATALSFVTVGVIFAMRRFTPRLPSFLVAIVGGSVLAKLMNIDVPTIGSTFGGIPETLPVPRVPDLNLLQLKALLPSALTIAFLAGVESLLSAVVADGMTGYRHRSNVELIAQGVANVASALFGGLPATGAIARTATNIRSGARSPVAGILHSVFLLLFMLVAAPLAAFIPLPSLAAILVVVAWNMSDFPRLVHLMSAPIGDRLVLGTTFALTVLFDLTVAIEVGVLLAAILFMHRMAEMAGIQQINLDAETGSEISLRTSLPPGVEIFEIQGPLFFGATHRLSEILSRIGTRPRMLILRMDQVPMIDASGVSALSEFVRRCRGIGAAVILSGVQPGIEATILRMGLGEDIKRAKSFEVALAMARDASG